MFLYMLDISCSCSGSMHYDCRRGCTFYLVFSYSMFNAFVQFFFCFCFFFLGGGVDYLRIFCVCVFVACLILVHVLITDI